MAEQLRKNRSLAMIVAAVLSLLAGLGVVLLEAPQVFKGMSTTQLTAVACMLVLPIIAIVVISYDRKARQHVAQRRADLAHDRTLQMQGDEALTLDAGGQAWADAAHEASGDSARGPAGSRSVLSGISEGMGSIDPSIAHDTLAGVEVMTEVESDPRHAGTPQRAHRRRVIHEPAYETPAARAER